ncbi:MAG: carboxypeptidase regulatory-like domain-containing protein [Nitrospirae bacterium]|nr:carboxypeptidase regulatory-like domain-containing protein [Candidatus Troglogloeales bacterium]
MGRFKFNLILLVLIAWLQPSLDLYGAVTTPPSRSKPSSSGRSIKNDLSSILRGIKPIPPRPGGPREIPLRPLPRAKGGKKGAQPGGLDLALQNTLGKTKMPVPDQNFEGVPNVDLVLPPDTNGDVGPNHYVQMVNRSFAIWDKNGNLLYGPAANNTLWSGFGGACDTNNDGDPIVLYDQLADRWLMSQFALFASDGFHQCIAISQTGDPTGAWYRYDFLISATKLHDYPKFGVWPDGYYMAVNQFDGNTFAWAGQGVVAFERDKMLVGLPSQIIYFDLFGDNPHFMGMLPSDLDGLIPPPSGSPNYFIEVDDDAWGWPSDRLQVFKFHVDWSNIANATFTGPEVVDLTADGYPFDADMCNFSFNCIPQPGTAQGLDAISDRLMYRLAYRNFGSHEALVVNHAVDADGTDHAGIRWYEIRDPSGTPFVFQAGTYAPDSDHRWMGSTAMDANGNMALGFSVSSGDTFPSIRYTGRLEGDPLGTLSQGEATLIAGGGSQTDSAARWGDYSMLTVDPVDDCTFWYTQEYYASTSDIGWQTRIGSFKFLSCITSPSGTLQGTVTDVATTLPISNAQVVAGASTTFTNASGFYQFSILPVGSYDVTTSALGYGPKTATAVTVTDGGTTVQDFSLVSLPIVTVQGTVTDGSGHGWPLYARIDITNYLGSPIFTNPVTGHYTVDLFQDTPYTFTVNAVSCGYNSVPRVIAPPAGGSIEDFALTVDATTCVVPGYAPLPSIYFEDFETGFGNWTMSGLLNPENEADVCGSIVAPFPSSSNGAYYGIDGTCTYNNGITNSGELTMNVPVLLPDTGSATLSFFSYEQTECEGNCPSDNRYVEISTDGGVSWALLGEGNTEGLWHQRVFDLSPYLGQSILIRFRFDTVDDISNDFFGWMVDNLSINAGTSVLISGGLIVGNVYDANTSNPLNGATIDDGSGNMTATFSTPDDPALDDGFYILFSSAGLQTLTASYTGYADEIQTVNVVENSAVIQNFNLLLCRWYRQRWRWKD